MRTPDVDIAVVGAGLTGCAAALAFARRGLGVGLIGTAMPPDWRTTALLAPSVIFLRRLGLWAGLEAHAAPLRSIRIIDATQRLIRAPEIVFDAGEIGLDAFGHNVENRHLHTQLAAHLATQKTIRHLASPLERIETGKNATILVLQDGCRLSARLVVGADGRNSRLRALLGIDTRRRALAERALVANFVHQGAHGNQSVEFHHENGPLTLVPLRENRSALVWIDSAAHIEHLTRLSKPELSDEVTRRSGRLYGDMKLDGPLQDFALVSMVARRLAAGRSVLAGEAAHCFPPIGAQGLNLGFRDIAVLYDLVTDAHDTGTDIAAPSQLGAWERARRIDIEARTAAVDVLLRSLTSRFPAIHALRGGTFALAGRMPLFRHAMMRAGLAPPGLPPGLMRAPGLPG